ncbi:MAG: hypothetical protein RIS29_2061 [Bacteroidota bacterium]|jgi:Mg2+ and Co2+ transporter CorA
MQLEIKKYLFDIRESIESVFDYLGAERNFLNTSKINYCAEQWSGNWK